MERNQLADNREAEKSAADRDRDSLFATLASVVGVVTFVAGLFLVLWMCGVPPEKTIEGISAVLDGFMRSPAGPFKGL